MRLAHLALAAAIVTCFETAASARAADSLPDLELPEAEPQLWSPLRRPQPLRPAFAFPIDKHTRRVVTGVHEGQTLSDSEITRTWDKAGRLASHRAVEAKKLQLGVTFSYDAQGHVLQRLEDYGTAKYTRDYRYDAAGRLISITYVGSDVPRRETTYGYDAAGNRTTQVTAGVTLRFVRSKTGAVIDVVREQPGKKPLFLYDGKEDKQGRVASFKADASIGGDVVTAGYDSAGRLAKLIWTRDKRKETIAISYDSAGRIVQMSEDVSEPTGTSKKVTTAKYDTAGRMIELAMTSSRTFGIAKQSPKGAPDPAVHTSTESRKSTFSYDAKGRMTSEKETAGGGDGQHGFKLDGETTYSYDAKGRLTKAETHEEGYPPLNRTTTATFTY